MSDALYEEDFFLWSQTAAEQVRARRFEDLDIENIAEELESLGLRDKREVIGRLRVLIMHLLKWQWQMQFVEPPSKSWRSTIQTQRDELADVFRASPSLLARIAVWVEDAYPRAVTKAVDEMGLLKNPFPSMCPFTPQQILDLSFFPEA